MLIFSPSLFELGCMKQPHVEYRQEESDNAPNALLQNCLGIKPQMKHLWHWECGSVGIWISVLSLRPWEACSDGTPQRLSLNQYFSRTRAEQCLKMACLLISAEMLKQLKCSHHLKELMSSCKTYKLFKSVADEPMWCLPLFFFKMESCFGL